MNRIEFRNDLPIPISIRFLVTKLGNYFVDIEEAETETDARFTIINKHDYDLVEVQPENEDLL